MRGPTRGPTPATQPHIQPKPTSFQPMLPTPSTMPTPSKSKHATTTRHRLSHPVRTAPHVCGGAYPISTHVMCLATLPLNSCCTRGCVVLSNTTSDSPQASKEANNTPQAIRKQARPPPAPPPNAGSSRCTGWLGFQSQHHVPCQCLQVIWRTVALDIKRDHHISGGVQCLCGDTAWARCVSCVLPG